MRPINKHIPGEAFNDPNVLIQIFIFKKGEYLGWDCFQKSEVTFGTTAQNDLQLEDNTEFSAKATANGDSVEIWNMGSQDSIYVNGKPIRTCTLLGPFDHVSAGIYKLKIKLNKQTTASLSPVLTDETKITPVDSEKIEIIPELINIDDIEQALSDFEALDKPTVPDALKIRHDESSEDPEEELELADDILKENTQTKEDEVAVLEEDFGPLLEMVEASVEEELEDTFVDNNEYSENANDEDDEDDDDENDDIEFSFLMDELIRCADSPGQETAAVNDTVETEEEQIVPFRLEIVKFRNDQVFDLQFLNVKSKYISSSTGKKFCIAEHKANQKPFIYYSPQFKIKSYKTNKGEMAIDHFYDENHLYRKRKQLYRFELRRNTEVIIGDGYFDYRVRNMALAPSIKVEDPPKEEPVLLNNIVKSSVVHLFFLIIVGLFVSLPNPDKMQEPVSRFVQIDTQQLKKNTPPPPAPKKEIPKEKPKPQKLAKVEKAQLKPGKTQKAKSKKIAKRGIAKKSGGGRMQAARGKGNGNVSNRNIKQVGILGMLGNTVGIQPTAAIAAVTNIDAVTSSHSQEANFKISGIVSELGDAKIQIPQGGAAVVSTRGATQVLRSGGGNGKRTVGVLSNGGTGQGEVMAMVKADVDRSFQIKGGGMSRAAVKRVIDQHLGELQFCYENATLANPSLMGGKITFEWKILMSGKVGAVGIKKSTIHSSDLHECIKSSLKEWQFPKPTGSEVIVSYPLIFDTVGF